MKNTTIWTIAIISILIFQVIWGVFYESVSWYWNILFEIIWLVLVALFIESVNKHTDYFKDKELPLKKRAERRLKIIELAGGLTVARNVLYFLGLISLVFGITSSFSSYFVDDKITIFVFFVVMGIFNIALGYFIKKSSRVVSSS